MDKAQKSPGQQMRFTSDELGLLRSTFNGNDKLLLLLRKIFLPELDPNAPVGQNIDLWMTINIKDLPPEQAIINLIARNELIMHVDQQLMQIKVLAQREETVDELADRMNKDSSR